MLIRHIEIVIPDIIRKNIRFIYVFFITTRVNSDRRKVYLSVIGRIKITMHISTQ